MEWSDVCENIAQDFHNIEIRIKEYIAQHGAILSVEVKSLLNQCIWVAGTNKFDIVSPDVPSSARSAANDLFNSLILVEEKLLNKISIQANT